MASVLHAAYSVKLGKRIHISREQLIDCVPKSRHAVNWDGSKICNTLGCEGCYNDVALAYAIRYGVSEERKYKYKSLDGISKVSSLFMSCLTCI